jgi:DNA-binding transcriptional MocR family regulator
MTSASGHPASAFKSQSVLDWPLNRGASTGESGPMRNPGDQLADALRAWRAGRGPLYRQLADAIVALAEAGSLEHGMRLPSERALADRLRVSRNTVTAAYQRLHDIGWLEMRRGSAPRLGVRSRGAEALGPHVRLSRILAGREPALVAFNMASPPPAPVVERALADPSAFLGAPVVAGTGYAPLGDIDFARAVTDHLRAQGIAAEPDEVVVTSGGQQAVWLAVTSIGGASPLIALEAVTYPGVFDAIQAIGGKPLALPMGPDGLDAAQAVALLEAAHPSAAYLTTFQNPTGTALGEEAAARIVHAAAACGTTIIDDRTLGDLAMDGRRRSPLASFPGAGPVITIGGLSKVFWGGLRLGWLHTNATLAAQLRHRRAAMDLGGPAFLQRIGAVLLADHFESTLAWRIGRLRESLEQARRAIAEEELDWEYRAPAGGPCLWLRLPGRSGERFAQRAAAAGAPVAPGSAFEALPGVATDRFRLPYYLPAQEIRRGIKLLANHAH